MEALACLLTCKYTFKCTSDKLYRAKGTGRFNDVQVFFNTLDYLQTFLFKIIARMQSALKCRKQTMHIIYMPLLVN